jgi:hypothetical protein
MFMSSVECIRRSGSRLHLQLIGGRLAIHLKISTQQLQNSILNWRIVHLYGQTRGNWIRGSSSRGSRVVKTWSSGQWDAFCLAQTRSGNLKLDDHVLIFLGSKTFAIRATLMLHVSRMSYWRKVEGFVILDVLVSNLSNVNKGLRVWG